MTAPAEKLAQALAVVRDTLPHIGGNELSVFNLLVRIDAALAEYRAQPSGWLPIESAPKDGNLYEVSASGLVRVAGFLKRQHLTTKGYMRVTLGGRSTAVHRLVAAAFIPNPEGLPEVNHLDGDKTNNSAINLAWCTRSQNMLHAYATGLHPGIILRGARSPNWGRKGDRHPQSMRVRATFPDGSHKDFQSQGMAAADGYSPQKISMCINGHRRRHGGATWQPLPAPPSQQNEEAK